MNGKRANLKNGIFFYYPSNQNEEENEYNKLRLLKSLGVTTVPVELIDENWTQYYKLLFENYLLKLN